MRTGVHAGQYFILLKSYTLMKGYNQQCVRTSHSPTPPPHTHTHTAAKEPAGRNAHRCLASVHGIRKKLHVPTIFWEVFQFSPAWRGNNSSHLSVSASLNVFNQNTCRPFLIAIFAFGLI